MPLHKSGEDYLEAILVLQKKKGMVRSADVARHMDVSKPSVCHAVATLKKGGFLLMDGDHSSLLPWVTPFFDFVSKAYCARRQIAIHRTQRRSKLQTKHKQQARLSQREAPEQCRKGHSPRMEWPRCCPAPYTGKSPRRWECQSTCPETLGASHTPTASACG